MSPTVVALWLVVLCTAVSLSADAFSVPQGQPFSKAAGAVSSTQQQQQQRQRQPQPLFLHSKDRFVPSTASSSSSTTTTTTTALEQASVAFPGDEASSESLWQRWVARRRQQDSSLVVTQPQPQQQDSSSFLKRHPLVAAMSITTVNAVVADLVTQLLLESSGGAWNWNIQRTLVFAAFGFLYQGMIQYAMVNGVWEKVFPGTSAKAVVAKICAMNLLSDPLLFMPTFYIFQQVMMTGAGTTTTAGLWGIVTTALTSYKANCLLDWRNSWMVWFPGHAVTYGLMPTHKRIPWMACLSFFYMCILSLTRGAVGV